MKLFLLFVLVGVIMLVLRQWVTHVPKKQRVMPKNPQNPSSRQARQKQNRDNSMHESIGLKPHTQNNNTVRVEPTLVSGGGLHEVKVVREVVKKTQPAGVVEASKQKSKNPDNLLSLILVAKDKPFAGYELLQSILARGLRFGEDKIFHRHVAMNGTGEVLFHLAAATKTGQFDLPNMGNFSCQGLICYLELEDCHSPVLAFETLYQTVEGLASDLQADILDPIKRPLTDETITLMRRHVEKFAAAESYEQN